MNLNPKGKPDFEGKAVGRVAPRPPKSIHSTPSKVRSLLILAICLAIPILALVLSLAAWNFNERHPRTDDAVARANLIGIAPRVSGPIIKVNVRDNQSVRSGDLLFAIDPADFQLAVDRAQAALAALDQQIEIAKSQDAQLKFQVKAADAAVQQATVMRDQDADTLRRLEPLLPKNFATQDQVNQARTNVPTPNPQLPQANEKLNQARVSVSSLATLEASGPVRVATLRTSQLELSYTRIYAPFD